MRKVKSRKMFMGYRLDVDNGGKTVAGKTEWLGAPTSFQFWGDAYTYLKRHYPRAIRHRITAVRLSLDSEIPRDYLMRERAKPEGKQNASN